MKRFYIFSYILIALIFLGCSNGQTQPMKPALSAIEFSNKIKQLPKAPIIDVRTPEEFVKGHLKNSVNINMYGNDFQQQIAKLDKSKPVFVYCLSGSRSSFAANNMRNSGFKEVYDLSGGIMTWRAANLPETTENTVANSSGMTKKQYDDLLKSEKLVLIDFYADWCAPCKKMKPYLDEISKEMKDKVVVIRINADDNQSLTKELKIDALPVLYLYKNKNLIWTNKGYISKEDVVKQLK
ncbi:MAG: thioredoxin fold domain-containing protein [Bacteroidia bacterium]|nr:thioredoxin fold domain-containing protein [Bacteroidia bacterium]